MAGMGKGLQLFNGGCLSFPQLLGQQFIDFHYPPPPFPSSLS